MMSLKHRWAFSLVCTTLLVPMTGNHAWGLGMEEFGNRKLSPRNYESWPGLAEVVNDSHRVYQNWVNGDEHCYYRSDTEALNATLQRFSEAKLAIHQVVLLPGPGEAKTFDGENVPCDWRLHILGGIARTRAKREKDGKGIVGVHPTIYVFVSKRVDLKKLDIPDGVKLLGNKQLRERYLAGRAE